MKLTRRARRRRRNGEVRRAGGIRRWCGDGGYRRRRPRPPEIEEKRWSRWFSRGGESRLGHRRRLWPRGCPAARPGGLTGPACMAGMAGRRGGVRGRRGGHGGRGGRGGRGRRGGAVWPTCIRIHRGIPVLGFCRPESASVYRNTRRPVHPRTPVLRARAYPGRVCRRMPHVGPTSLRDVGQTPTRERENPPRLPQLVRKAGRVRFAGWPALPRGRANAAGPGDHGRPGWRRGR